MQEIQGTMRLLVWADTTTQAQIAHVFKTRCFPSTSSRSDRPVLPSSSQVTNLRTPSKWHIYKEGKAGNNKKTIPTLSYII
jgi:hypothetical protein